MALWQPNGRINITRMVELNLEICSVSFPVIGYLAPDVPTDLILGRNFLRQADISCLPERGIWTFRDQIFHFCKSLNTAPEMLTCLVLTNTDDVPNTLLSSLALQALHPATGQDIQSPQVILHPINHAMQGSQSIGNPTPVHPALLQAFLGRVHSHRFTYTSNTFRGG